jgi:hypothetical protein
MPPPPPPTIPLLSGLFNSNYWLIQSMRPLILQICAALYSFMLGPNIFFSNRFSNSFSPCVPVSTTHRVHTHKSNDTKYLTGKKKLWKFLCLPVDVEVRGCTPDDDHVCTLWSSVSRWSKVRTATREFMLGPLQASHPNAFCWKTNILQNCVKY